MKSIKGKLQPAGIGMTPSETELGTFIRARRLELDLRQTALAKVAGLGQNVISLIEIGTRKYLNDRQLNGLAKVLQCDVEQLRRRMPVKHIPQPTTELGKLIRSRREEISLSLATFAQKMGMTSERASALELTKRPTIGYKRINLLAHTLDLDPSAFTRFVGTTHKQTASELGRLVRDRRKTLAMSGSELARKLVVTPQFVNQIESGKQRLSRNDKMIKKLAQMLKLDVSELEAVRPTRRLKRVDRTNPLGEFLAARRVQLCHTQREIGERAGIPHNQVSAIERGRYHPSTLLLNDLAKILDCEIPPELTPSPRKRKRGRPRGSSIVKRETALGKFLTTRRLELELSQAQVATRAGVSFGAVSSIERGTHHPSGWMLQKISQALACEIPPEVIQILRPRGWPRTKTS